MRAEPGTPESLEAGGGRRPAAEAAPAAPAPFRHHGVALDADWAAEMPGGAGAETRRSSRPWLVGGGLAALLLLLGGGGAYVVMRGGGLPPGTAGDAAAPAEAEAATLTLRAEAEGRVRAILVRPGDHVTPGQPVVLLDQSELRGGLAEAEAQHAAALRQRAGLADQQRRLEEALRARAAVLGREEMQALQRLRQAEAEAAGLLPMVAGGLLAPDRLLHARLEAFQAAAEVRGARSAWAQDQQAAQALTETRQAEALEAERAAEAAARRAEALRHRLEGPAGLLATQAGQVVELRLREGEAVTRGMPVLTIRRIEGDGAALPPGPRTFAAAR